MYPTNTNEKKVGVTLIISDTADCKTEKVIKDKKGHYVIIKGSILQKDITPHYMYALNNRGSN